MDADEVLERSQWDVFWVPEDVGVVDLPEVLYLISARPLAMLNAVTRVRATPSQLPGIVRQVSSAHEGRPSRWQLSPGNRSDALERELRAAGYAPGDEHYGYTIDVDRFEPAAPAGIEARPVLDIEGLYDAVDVAERAFTSKLGFSDEDLEGFLRDCTRPGARVHRTVAYDADTGAPLSSGGLTAYPDLKFGLLWAGGTVPEARGRGAYAAVLAGRVAHARSLGLTRVGLYAKVDTSAPIVERNGFTRGGPMVFWNRAP